MKKVLFTLSFFCILAGVCNAAVLSVSPTLQNVSKDAGTTTFNVSNTGTGTMTWTAQSIFNTWISITSGTSGTNSGTITCAFGANTSTLARTGTIRVTASGATGSPVDLTVTQEPTPTPTPSQPVLSVSPTLQNVSKDAGTTTFNVSNTGTGTMTWTVAVTSGGSWLSIISGTSGTNSGTINCSYSANTSTSTRTATIRITASGATGSPKDVTVTQSPSPTTGCTATLDEDLSLHIPNLFYVNQTSGSMLLWADLVYEFNSIYPTLIFFKLTNAGIINNPAYLCTTTKLSADLNIYIPDVLLPDGITHLWVDLEYDTALSTEVKFYWTVSDYGVVSN